MQTGLLRRACIRGFWPLFFVRLVTDINLSPLQLVLLGTVMELTILVSEIPTGIVADLYSRKWSVVISFLVIGIGIVVSAFVETYGLLVLSQVLIGFGATFHSGAETAWITDEVGSATEAEPLILKRAGWELIAAVVGVAIFSGVAALTTLTTSLAIIGVVYALWAGYLTVQMPETNFTRTVGEGWAGFTAMLREGARQCRRIQALRVLITVIFIGGLAKEVIDRLDVQRLIDVGLPEDIDEVIIVGALVIARSLFAAALLVIARRHARGRSAVPALAGLLVGVAVGIALLAHSELLVVAGLGLILQGGFHLATEPLIVTWTNTFASSSARATVHSFMGQTEAFGEIIGGITLGALAEFTTVPIAMTVSAVLFLAAAGLTLTARALWDESLLSSH